MNTRFITLLAAAALFALPAASASAKKRIVEHRAEHVAAAGPEAIGTFEDWTAATHVEGGQKICYAFTRVKTSTPAIRGRGPVVLTVTERPTGRDAVAMEAGMTYAKNASVTMQVDQTGLDFYTAGQDAFARDGKAAVKAFQRGARAIARSPGTRPVTDTFSLNGFGKAYDAIVKACPAK